MMKWLVLALLFGAGMMFALRQTEPSAVANTPIEQAEFRYTVQFQPNTLYSIYDVYCDHGVRLYVSTFDRKFMLYGGDCK